VVAADVQTKFKAERTELKKLQGRVKALEADKAEMAQQLSSEKERTKHMESGQVMRQEQQRKRMEDAQAHAAALEAELALMRQRHAETAGLVGIDPMDGRSEGGDLQVARRNPEELLEREAEWERKILQVAAAGPPPPPPPPPSPPPMHHQIQQPRQGGEAVEGAPGC
jgi:TolA-binding protein